MEDAGGGSGREQLQKVAALAASLQQLNVHAAQARETADGVLGATVEEHRSLASFVQAVLAAEAQIKLCNERSRAAYPLVRNAMKWCREFPRQTQCWAQPDGSPGPCEVLETATGAHELLLIDELAPRYEMLRLLPHEDNWKNRWHWWRMQRDGGEAPLPDVPREPEALLRR
eukprot:EG_transcript_25214